MARDYGKAVKGGVKVRSTKVVLPRSNPLGTHRNPRGFVAAPKAPKSRAYSKSSIKSENADPMQFTNVGFGDTGLTGES